MNDTNNTNNEIEEKTKDSYLQLEETIIPYPDSFDIMKNNEKSYILRLENTFEYEKQIMISRMSMYDNEDYSDIIARSNNLIEWFHSTVYNYNEDILTVENKMIFDTSYMLSGIIFDTLHKNMNMIKEQLFYNDIGIIKDDKFFRYILSRNKFIYRGKCSCEDFSDNLVNKNELTNKAKELLLIISHPKRGSIIFGERAYQNSLLKAGELTQIIISIAMGSSSMLRIRSHAEIYDFVALSKLGIEDNNSIITNVFEIHNN